jgi:fructose-1,6-bisphosphatase/inositol monophosphatase family enzyme
MDAILPTSSFSNHTFASILDEVVKVAKEAGKIIMDAVNTNTDANVHLKGRVDLVTDTDRKVEGYIISTLKEVFPSSRFLAEEEVSATEGDSEVLSADPTWIIDPIDGTTNFVHKHPVFCVSIALAIGKQVVVAVVFNPVLGELFTATRGGGAFLNGVPIRVASAASLDKAVVATNVGVDRTPEGAEFLTQNLRKLLLNNVQSIRSNGSAAWEMSSVACGRLDVFYERGIHSWDIAAASLLITEAGGVVANLDGSELNLLSRQILCGNQNMVNIISNLLFSKLN